MRRRRSVRSIRWEARRRGSPICDAASGDVGASPARRKVHPHTRGNAPSPQPSPGVPGEGEEASIASTKEYQGEARKYRALIQLEVYPLGQDAWGFYATQLIAPKETFQKDLPVMLAQSMTREAIDAQNRRFAALQAANKQVQQAFDARNKDWERNQLITLRSNANFDEVIRGYRTVEDTSTGNRTSLDLGNVHQVVENLNYYDPGRYKEIPLS